MFGLFKTFRNAFLYVYFKLFQLFKAAIYAFASRSLASHLVFTVSANRVAYTKYVTNATPKRTEPKPQLGAFGRSNYVNLCQPRANEIID